MRFIKRLSAVALAIVITVSSIQIPGGTSYAAEAADGIANGQDVTILTAEETEDTETAKPDEGALTDDDSRTGGDSKPGDDNAAGDDSRPGDDNAAGDDNQPGDDNAPCDDSQPGDGNAAGDDVRPDHESVSEEETDAGQVSGNDAGETALSVDTKETETEETEIVEAEIEGAYQFGGMPSVGGGMSVFSVSTYDDSAEEYLYQQMLKRVSPIDLSDYKLSASDTSNLVSGVLNEHPDLYFVSRSYTLGYGWPSYETISDLYMTYSTDYDDAAFKKKTEAALACVTDGMSNDMKATVLHDYLVINVEYDYDNYLSGNIPTDSFNAYGALVNGTAVCNGYALAYKYLLNQVGIESYMVTSSSMNHAWNMVKLDGKYYHVDTTWDDPVRDMVGRVCHDNLFRSDTNFGEHYGWTVTSGSSAVDYKATDTKYENAFWVDCTSPLVFDGTDCYYISKKEMSLNKASFSNINATGTEVISVGRWMSASGGYYVGAFSGLYRINGRLFYNDGNSIYSINPDGTDRKTEFTPEKTGSNQIYYSAYRNGQVVYALHTSPNLSEKQTVLTAEIEGVGEPEPPEETYNITYVLDGGTNDKDNPATYTAGTKTIVLKDAAKAGYKFEGWYKDSAYMQKVTEIPIGSTGDITLYAKWIEIRENGLNADNLNYTFTTLDDETVSSRADGKPKVLFFFKPDCYYCQKTSQDLSKNIKNFSGVDIYVIESFNSCTKDEVANFKKTYGCDEITYCYDKDGMSKYRVWNYVDMTNVSNGNSVTTPVIIFIDSQNRVQYGTAGARSWTQILSDLQEYCGYGYEDTKETYKITYELNGGTNDSANPGTYTSETETITLKDAVKDGYTFEGWYKDAGFKEKVTEIVKGSAGDITLYAKWKEIPVESGTYRIIYELNGGTNDSENPDTYTSDMETITLKEPSKEGFIFEGWYADASFNRKVTEIVKGSTGDITLYAKWKAAQVVIDPDHPENIRAGVYVRFTDYYRLGENSRPCYKYTGAAVKPAVEVYNNGTLLTSGTDYTIAYKNNTKVGAASLSVKGMGNFAGASNAVSFNIVNADIRLDTDHPTKMTVTAGTKVTPIIMNGDKKLTAKDYKLEGDNLVNGKYAQATVGTPNILTVTGIGSYAGSSFTIAVTVIDKKDARKFAVTVDKNFKPVYDGNTIDLASLFSSPTGKGSITVTDSKEKTMVLENGKDFSVLCTSSLRDVGTVKFTVTGMGEYTGSVSKSFRISPFKVIDNIKFEVTFDNREYGYKASGTTVDNLKVTYLGATTSADDDVVLTQGKDYKVSYVNNKKVSTEIKKAQVRITFLGNYRGSKPVSKDFTIAAARLSMQTADNQAANTKVIVPDKVYDKAGEAYKSTPIVTVDGVRIKASNYTVSYTWVAEMGEGVAAAYVKDNNVKITLGELDDYAKVKVTITPKGVNYALADGVTAIEGEYYVRKKAEGAVDLSEAKVTFSDKDGNQLKALEYNGRAYYTPEGNNPEGGSAQADPNAVYVSVSVNGKPVNKSLYNIVWTDAAAKGKATVVVTGKGTGAVGSRNQTISIKAMALKGRDIACFMVNMANNLKNIL